MVPVSVVLLYHVRRACGYGMVPIAFAGYVNSRRRGLGVGEAATPPRELNGRALPGRPHRFRRLDARVFGSLEKACQMTLMSQGMMTL